MAVLMFGKPPVTRQAWLESLARRLAWAFPEEQAKDIFADYREQFEVGQDRGKSDNEIIEALGAPSEAVAQLMEEDPDPRMDLLRHCLLWGAVLVLCWAFVWVTFWTDMASPLWVGICVFLPLSNAALFMLVRGPGRVTLERIVTPEKQVSPVRIFLVPLVLMSVCFVGQEILMIRFGWYFDEHKIQIGVLSVVLGTVSLSALFHVRKRAAVERRFPTEKKPTVWLFLLPLVIAALLNGFVMYLCARPWSQWTYMPVRFYLVVGVERSVLILRALMVWTLARCFSGSIRYLPAAIHAIGCAWYVLCTGIFYSYLDFEGQFGELLYIWFLPNLLPYAAGVVLAAGIWLLIRSAGTSQKES